MREGGHSALRRIFLILIFKVFRNLGERLFSQSLNLVRILLLVITLEAFILVAKLLWDCVRCRIRTYNRYWGERIHLFLFIIVFVRPHAITRRNNWIRGVNLRTLIIFDLFSRLAKLALTQSTDLRFNFLTLNWMSSQTCYLLKLNLLLLIHFVIDFFWEFYEKWRHNVLVLSGMRPLW